ncbi:phage tail tape measure protein [Clostridium perfringens]|uniref:phage tail tape measure protein n=1 Tax=Clostridium perfringens TaxID=1502 RepID=UPI001DB603E7|nr:phage tail tape measure protein [Clostridium perfringens]
MGANVKIGANTSDFQKQMKDMVRELKSLGSTFNLASTQAKLFGNANEQLKVKQAELTEKMKLQNKMINLQKEAINKLTNDIQKQKEKREELSKKIEEVTKKYKESSEATGKNSEETKKLGKSLADLKEEYARNERAIDSSNRKIDTANMKMNKSKTELLENKKALEEVDKKLKDINLDKFSQKMDKVSNATGKAASALKPAAIAVTGFGVAAAVTEMKFQDGIANINTLLDDQSHLDGYKNKIMEVSNQTGIDLKIVTDGMYQAISSIGDGGAETEKIFDTMAKSAKAGGAEVKDAVALISAGMKGYNQVNDETAKKISDLAFQTAKLGVTTFPEMASSMQPLFPLASNLNLSMTDLFTNMATLTGVTGNTSEVCTQLKAVFSNLIKPTADMQKLMEKYGFQNGQAMLKSEGLIGTLKILQKETGGQSDKMGELFSSTEGLTAITALTSSQFDTLADKSKKMNEAIGTTDSALAKINNTTGNDLRTSLNLAKNSLVGFGEVLAPFISLAAKGIGGIAKAFGGLSEGQKKAVVGIGAFVVGSYGALAVTTKVTGTIRNAIKDYKAFRDVMEKLKIATKLQTAAQKALNFVTEMSPVGKIILVVGLVVGALTYLYNHCEWFRNGVNKIFSGLIKFFTETVPNKLKQLINFFKNDWKEILLLIVNPFAGAFALAYKHCEGFRNGVDKLFSNIKEFFTKSIPDFFKWLISKLTQFKTDFINKIKEFGTIIKTRIKNYIEEVKFIFSNLPKLMGILIGKIAGEIYKGFLNIKIFITKTIPDTINSIKQWFAQLPEAIGKQLLDSYMKVKTWGNNLYISAKKTGKDFIYGVIDYVKELPHKIWNKITEAYDGVTTWGNNMYQAAKKVGKEFVDSIVDYVKELPTRFKNWLKESWNKVSAWGEDLKTAGKESGKKLVDSIVDTVKAIPGQMKEIGKNIVHGIWDGITGAIGWIKSKIKQFCDGIVEGFKSSLDIHSPSRVLRDQVGKFMAQGVGVGFVNEMEDINLDIKQSLDRTINTNIVPSISNVDLEKINTKLNNTNNNNIVVVIENVTNLDGEVISTKVYKKVAKQMKSDENSYRVTKGKKGGRICA